MPRIHWLAWNKIAPRRIQNMQFCRKSGNANHAFYAMKTGDRTMNSIIYLVGLVVVVLAILSFLGLR
jgi:hypothetical protein